MQVLADELPEGEEILTAVMAEWDRRLERLRQLASADSELTHFVNRVDCRLVVGYHHECRFHTAG